MSKHKPSQRIVAIVLSIVMMLGMMPMTVMAQGDTDLEETYKYKPVQITTGSAITLRIGGTVTAFEKMEDHIRWQNTLEPYFPGTLPGTVEGEIADIPVKWHTEEDYDEKSPQKGLYIFNAVLDGDYSPASDLELPHITVYIPKSSGRFNLLAMGGAGTDSSPLEITTAAQLAEIATLVNLGRLEQFLLNDKFAKVNLVLMNNIDLSAYGRNFNDGKGWIPIGWAMSESPYTQYYFNGNFDGNGHIITGLYINRSDVDRQGLFGAIGGGSTVKNLGLVDVNIKGRNIVGGITGIASATQNNESIVQDCYVTGSISGNNHIGGVVGAARGIMDRCYSTAKINGNDYVGGITGSLAIVSVNTSPAIKNCAALNPSVSIGIYYPSIGRIVGWHQEGDGTLAGNIAFSGMEVLVNGSPKSDMGNVNDHIDGLGKSADDIKSDGTLGGLFINDNNPWTTANGSLPGFNGVVEMPKHIIDIPTGQFFEGTGENEAHAYQISTPQQLAKLADLVNSDVEATRNAYNDKHYKLMNDLDLSSYRTDGGWMPIGGASGKEFKGKFNGKGKIITGLYINRPDTNYQGLFGYLNTGAVVENLGIVTANIEGRGYVGGVAGLISNSTVQNCFVTGSIKGNYVATGGVVGEVTSSSTVQNSYNTASVESSYSSEIGWTVGLGGVVGRISYGIVENSYNMGRIVGKSRINNVGGIAGVILNGTIKNSASLYSSISSTLSNNGRVAGNNDTSNTLENNIAFSGMTVNGAIILGGAANNKEGLDKTAAQIATNADNVLSNLFTTANGWTYTAGGLPILTGFADGVQDATLPPHLVDDAASPYFYGTGADADNAYQISTPEQLAKLAELVNSDVAATRSAYNSKYYKLMNDIDISGIDPEGDGTGWVPIGIDDKYFIGVFDGNNKTITGLYINRPKSNKQGLFGYIAYTSIVFAPEIKNLNLIEVDIVGSEQIGGLVGFANNLLAENNSVTGRIQGVSKIGGVIGEGYYNTIIRQCFASVVVTATGDNAGGLAGYLITASSGYKPVIEQSYSTGKIAGKRITGGLVGLISGGEVTNSYSSADISGTEHVGGIGVIVGDTIVNYCYASGKVSGTDKIGGIVGSIDSTTDTVRNSVALNPSVSGTNNVGRVAGSNSGTLQNNYAFSGMTGGGMDKTLNELDGQDLAMGKDLTTQAGNAAFWTTEDNWDTENNGTVWDSTVWTFTDGKLPTLKNVGGNQSGDGGLHLIQRDISGANVTVNGIYPYNGSNIFDYDLTVVFDGHTLESAKDYIIFFSGVGKDVGSYDLTIWGKGNYKGSKTTSFSISKATPTVDDINIVSSPSLSYNGSSKEYGYKVIEPKTGMGAITVYYEGVDGTDYGKSTIAPTNVGTYKITLDIAEGANFTAATDLDVDYKFTITPKPVSADMIGEVAAQTYTGRQIIPEPAITDTAIGGGTQLIEGVDFEYSYGENLYAGDNAGSVSITGKGNYEETTDVKTFDITVGEQNPTITQAANLTKGAKTLDLRTLVSGAVGEVSFTLADAGDTGSTLDGYTLTSGTTIGEVKIDISIAAQDINDDDILEYNSFSQANAITINIVNRPSGGSGGGSYTPPPITPPTPEVKPDQPITDTEDTDATANSRFTDISSHWAKDSIDFVVGRGLLVGTSETAFAPNIAMTRGMLVTVLGRLAEVDAIVYTANNFTDVAQDEYYSSYIQWAYSKGIVNGIGNSQFAPDRAITREEIAVIFANFAKAMGYTLPIANDATTYADKNDIGDIYKASVIAMQQAGIMIGDTNNNFNPKSSATRAEVSAMLERYIKLTISPATV